MNGPAASDHLHGQALVATTDPATLGATLARDLAGGWQASAGSVRIGEATIDFHAWPDGLRLDAYAGSLEELGTAEEAINGVLARVDVRAIAWRTRPSTLPGAPPLEPPVYNFPFDEDHDD
jgi:hypothetical protein